MQKAYARTQHCLDFGPQSFLFPSDLPCFQQASLARPTGVWWCLAASSQLQQHWSTARSAQRLSRSEPRIRLVGNGSIPCTSHHTRVSTYVYIIYLCVCKKNLCIKKYVICMYAEASKGIAQRSWRHRSELGQCNQHCNRSSTDGTGPTNQ